MRWDEVDPVEEEVAQMCNISSMELNSGKAVKALGLTFKEDGKTNEG